MLGVGVGIVALFGYWCMEGIQLKVPERRGGRVGKHGVIPGWHGVCGTSQGDPAALPKDLHPVKLDSVGPSQSR